MNEQITNHSSTEFFSFGDAESVLKKDILSIFECVDNDKYYQPPLSMDELAKIFRSNPHHSSAIYVKRNILASTFKPNKYLNRSDFSAFVLDYLILGNGYFYIEKNLKGGVLNLKKLFAKYMRVGNKNNYFIVGGISSKEEQEIPENRVVHLKEHDINQELYGTPEYLSCLQAAMLNEASTLFRRRYYLNGSHAGYIMYISDPSQTEEDIDKIREGLKNSKGPGNFRNFLLYSPSGKKDGVQIIPISEVAAKDEFLGIKDATREDILAAHRVPPSLLGIIPKNTGGFGNPAEAAKVFSKNELEPLQNKLREVNDMLGIDVIDFNEYTFD